jgi:hypothetical protein
MISLVGCTGFVGSNILAAAGNAIDGLYNSANVEQAYGTAPRLLIYAGVRAEKYLANTFPEKDLEQIVQAENNIKKINPQKLVLISTIDVFKSPDGVDENTGIVTEGLHTYGYNRYLLEQWVRENYPDALIVRLPGLFGKNIKKNFIYDYINVIPYMLKKQKFEELLHADSELGRYYIQQDNGFYRMNAEDADRELLKGKFAKLGFSALNFTDSRSVYQFYNLNRLWGDINVALDEDIRMLHLATEKVSAGEVYKYLTGSDFVNELEGVPARYDYRTLHSELYGGTNGYICSKAEVLKDIKAFVDGYSGK